MPLPLRASKLTPIWIWIKKFVECIITVQGDQIGQIFAYILGAFPIWAVFLKIENFWATFVHDKRYVCINFDKK
jgi:hypothetical protein